ncbi:MAG: rod shape-determining protein RodA [Bacteroidales bacterium]|nr:rod shape-determining protein RodA [Candidatus Cryptobacteroides aphodequi]
MTGRFDQRALGRRIDWKLIFCWIALVAVGILSIYSTIHNSGVGILDPDGRSGKQFIWFCAALVVGYVVIFVLKPHIWEVLSLPGYLAVLVLLVAVIVFGVTVNGSRSWFELGPLRFQPAEISKLTTALLVAHLLRGSGMKMSRRHDILLLLGVIGLPMAIILCEGETGSVLVYLGLLFVLYREGLSGWWIVLIAACIVLFIITIKYPLWVSFLVLAVMLGAYALLVLRSSRGSSNRTATRRDLRIMVALLAVAGTIFIFSTNFVFSRVLKPYQKERIEVLLGMTQDIRGAGYNVHQSMIAIGSGGFAGKGYLKGTQTTYGFVPEQSTDFIFCTIGEEGGFLGCLAVILLYVFLIARVIRDAEQCREPFTRVYGYCFASCVFMHLIINVGMTIGLMPVIGIPLPFVSYGGSSLMSFSLMLFIFLALYAQEKKYF